MSVHQKAAVGAKAPGFDGVEAAFPDLSSGKLSLGDYTSGKGKWVILLFYPLDFTFVCPTELIAFSDRAKEFEELNCQLLGVSIDSVFSHLAWMEQPRNKGGLGGMNFPLISDLKKDMCNDYEVMLPDGYSLRGLIIIDPDNVVQQITKNNAPVGRSVDETLRLLQAFQFVRAHGDQVCPANWQPGQKTITEDTEKSKSYFAETY